LIGSSKTSSVNGYILGLTKFIFFLFFLSNIFLFFFKVV
ncbi:unnamed protein product, partial [Brassica rapa subsp. narinosa]